MEQTWVDVHSHILPGIDDGSRSAEESMRMLRESARQQVGMMIATPHFYADRNSPERFLRHRAAALERLQQAQELTGETEAWPRIACGAEVAYFTGLSNCDELPQLCVEGTRVLLLEMPFRRWSGAVLQDIYRAKDRFGLQIVVAHIERYIDEQPTGTLEGLLQEGLLLQANAESFLHWSSRGKALRRVREGKIFLLGSDCHNMAARAPNLGRAVNVLEKRCGAQTVRTLRHNAWKLFASAGALERNE